MVDSFSGASSFFLWKMAFPHTIWLWWFVKEDTCAPVNQLQYSTSLDTAVGWRTGKWPKQDQGPGLEDETKKVSLLWRQWALEMLEPWGPSSPPCRESSKNESCSEERGEGGREGGSREGRGERFQDQHVLKSRQFLYSSIALANKFLFFSFFAWTSLIQVSVT